MKKDEALTPGTATERQQSRDNPNKQNTAERKREPKKTLD